MLPQQHEQKGPAGVPGSLNPRGSATSCGGWPSSEQVPQVPQVRGAVQVPVQAPVQAQQVPAQAPLQQVPLQVRLQVPRKVLAHRCQDQQVPGCCWQLLQELEGPGTRSQIAQPGRTAP